jgi:ABC-2 type transport system permease protein
VPILNRINPAALIVDSFYSLDTYGAGARYAADTILLVVIGIVFCIGSVLVLRRKRYASV